ncbi:hypothetical protein HY546_01330 [archaeon]|nr:hypothetical protein [archaeon]
MRYAKSLGEGIVQYAKVVGSVNIQKDAFQEQERHTVEVLKEGATAGSTNASDYEKAQAGQIGQLVSGNRNVGDKLAKIISNKKRGKKDPWQSAKKGASGIVTIRSVIAGEPPAGEAIPVLLGSNGNLDNAVFYLNRNNVKDAPSGEPFKVVITGATNTTIDGKNKTIVVEGGDVYIDQNIGGKTAGGAALGALGIVVLPDFSIDNNEGRWGGNVYICSSVTETHMNVSSDGSLYTYGDLKVNGDQYAPRDPVACNKSKIDSATGLPVYNGATEERLIQSNQYTNYGSIVSKNSYGGSTRVPAITGYGEKVQQTAGMSASDFETLKNRARFQDLNFLRWATVTENPDYDTMKATDKNAPEQCWDFYGPNVADRDGNVKLGVAKNGGANFSTSLGTKCSSDNPADAINAPPKTGIINFFYADYTSTLPLFKDLVNQVK